MQVKSENPPLGATHVLIKGGSVTYFRAVDFEFGSYDHWNGREYYTKRQYPPTGLTRLTPPADKDSNA